MNVKREIRSANVAVVGGAGFLGSHLTRHLIEDRQCNVLVIDNLFAGRREFVHSAAHFEHADITKSEAHLRNLFRGYSVEYVFNYAAHPYVPMSFERPLFVFETNAVGALQVINAAQEAECVKGILQVSSAEVYGHGMNFEEQQGAMMKGIDEGYSITPHSSYGAAKAAIDAMIPVRWKEAKTPVIGLRQFNCIGERETHPYVVPEIISQVARDGLTLEVFDGTPLSGSRGIRLGNNSTRDFLYAGDAVKMAVELLEKGEFGEVYNLGSEQPIKVYDLVPKIGGLMGKGKECSVEPDEGRMRPWEIWYLQSDNAKIYGVIDHRPEVHLDEALKAAIRWFDANGGKWPWEKRPGEEIRWS